MYKSQVNTQLSFEVFNQPIGLTMNPENRWIKKAEHIPWLALEKDYAKNFRNNKGNIAKPLRMALGALLIQMFYSCSDEEVVQSIKKIPTCSFSLACQAINKKSPLMLRRWSIFENALMPRRLPKLTRKSSLSILLRKIPRLMRMTITTMMTQIQGL